MDIKTMTSTAIPVSLFAACVCVGVAGSPEGRS